MKKIMNHAENMVREMCWGMSLAYPEISWNQNYNFLTRKQLNREKVTIISGGGSGHEPAHGGFVGKGMLDAAVCGDIFASPSQIQIYQAVKHAAGSKGVLLIIKNYSGDMMNFKNAADMAQEEGIDTAYVKVDDDIAVKDSLYTVGRRGVAGTVFVHKIAGAAAERGYDLTQVKTVAEKAAGRVKTIGFAFSSCVVPAKGTPTFTLMEEEMEYGIGIHGEPGIRREPVLTADELAERMTEELIKELKMEYGGHERTAILINGLGGTPLQELYVLNYSVRKALAKRGIEVCYDFTGNYMTSIEMKGASLSILPLDEELEELLTDTCDTPAFKVGHLTECVSFESTVSETRNNSTKKEEAQACLATPVIQDEELKLENITCIIEMMSTCIINHEKEFCQMDSYAGDGDFGMSVAKGFRKLQEEWSCLLSDCSKDIGEFLGACGLIIMEYCGGASGPVWGSAFRKAGIAAKGKTRLLKKDVAELLWAAVEGIQRTGERSFGRGAVPGDKTLIDALVPCADTWTQLADADKNFTDIFSEAAKAAEEGAEATRSIVARMGRAGTVGKRSLGYPDAGAYALGVIFRYIAEGLKSQE